MEKQLYDMVSESFSTISPHTPEVSQRQFQVVPEVCTVKTTVLCLVRIVNPGGISANVWAATL